MKKRGKIRRREKAMKAETRKGIKQHERRILLSFMSLTGGEEKNKAISLNVLP